jgi:hypothetical protein
MFQAVLLRSVRYLAQLQASIGQVALAGYDRICRKVTATKLRVSREPVF